MQNSILNNLGFDPGILIILILVFLVFILLYLASVSMKMSRFMKRYKIFMRGKDGVSLERAFESNFIEVDRIGEQNKIQAQEIAHLREQMSRTPVKTGIVKYDAFPDVGGRMSFALAMLDMNNTGFVINAIHSTWFKNKEDEEQHRKQIEDNMSKYKKYVPDNPNLIQVGSTIVDEKLKKEIEQENNKKSK